MPFSESTPSGLVLLNFKGHFAGYNDSDVPQYVPLVLSSYGPAYVATAPAAPAVAAVLLSRTSAKVDWTPGPLQGAPVTAWRVYKDGVQVGADLGANLRTLTITGLATATPEIIFAFTVKGVSGDGLGAVSNAVNLQWAGTPTSAPTAPTNLQRGTLSSTSVPLTWEETTDTTVDKHGIFEGDTLIRDGLSAAASVYTYGGLIPGSAHTNVNVRRHNAAGWSPASNTLTFTTPTGSGGVVQAPVMGTDTLGPNPNYYTDWGASRVYRANDCIPAFNATNPAIISVTDDPSWAAGGGAGVATLVRNMLIDFYEGSGSAARAACELHVALRNEEDSEFQSGALPTAVINTHSLLYDTIHELTGGGARRFPKASAWIDMTTYQIRIKGAGPRFRVVAPFLDGFACSMYPTGRDKDPIIWTKYDDYCAAIFDTLEDWRTVNPSLNQFATWEIGSPIDHAQDTGGPNNLGTTNWTIRPRYFAGGRASGPTAPSATQPMGSNYEGFLNYIYRQCVERNIVMREQLYWNRQSNPTIPNPFKHDRNLVTPAPDTATAWHDWTPGSRLADL